MGDTTAWHTGDWGLLSAPGMGGGGVMEWMTLPPGIPGLGVCSLLSVLDGE